MYIGTERLPMVATAWGLNVFWLGCAVDTRCGNVVFTLDSPAAAHHELSLETRSMLGHFGRGRRVMAETRAH